MKNIMLITQSLRGGGAEKVVANLSIALSKYCNVYIISYSKDNDEFFYKGERINLNIPGGYLSIKQKLINAIIRINKIKYLKQKLDIDLAISFVPQTDYVNILTSKIGCKNLIEISSNSLVAFESKKSRILRELILKRADHIITVSEGSRLQVINKFGLNPDIVTTIYNLIDIEEIQKNAKQQIYNDKFNEKKYIIAIGSFRKPKGHWHLIKAFSTIMNDIPEYSLVILGDGEYREKYVEIAKIMNIPQTRLIMPGYISNPYPILFKADLMVFSSLYEGFGNVIVEAMSCGIPIVSTDCDFGPREILAPDTNPSYKTNEIEYGKYGCLIAPFSIEDINYSTVISKNEKLLGKAILYMIKNLDMRMKYKVNGLQRCKDFDINRTIKSWIDVLNL